MDSTATIIIISLAAAWLVQYYLAWWQMRRFYKRIAVLRRDGTVSIGMAGSSWRRKQYAVLVVDKAEKIVHIEQLSGWTVLATLKPVHGLDGQAMSNLFDDNLKLPVSDKLLLALRNAASYIKDQTVRATPAPADEGRLSESAPAT